MSDELVAKLRISVTDAFSAPLKDLGDKLDQVLNKSKKSEKINFLAGLNQTAQMLERFGARARAAIETPIDKFAEFEFGMKGLQAVGNFDDLTINNLADHIKKKSVEIGAATGDIQSSFENLIAANYDLEESKILSAESFKLARGNKLTNEDATNLVVGTMQGFGIKDAKQAPHVANVLAAADDVSTASAGMLGDFLSRTGSTAKASNTSLETMAAIGAILKDSGRKDLTESATSMNNVINRLSAPSKLGGKALASAGISGKNLMSLREDVTQGKLLQAIARIDKGFNDKKFSAAKRTDLIKAIFGEGGQEMSIFRDLAASLRLGEQGVSGKVKTFETGVEGTTDRKSAILDNSATARMEKMRAKWDILLIEMGERFEPAVSGILASIGPMVESIGAWMKENPELSKQLGTLAVTSGLFATVAGPALTSIGSMITMFMGVGSSAKFGMKGVSLAATGFVKLGTKMPGVTGALTKLSGSFLGKAGLVGAAAAAGVGIGLLIRELFDTDKHISNLIAKFTGAKIDYETTDKKGLQAGGDMVMADGTVMGADGLVKSLGDGNKNLAPKALREARASGASTLDEINKFITDRKAAPVAGAAVGPDAAAQIVDAVREQTAAQRRVEKATKENTDAINRRMRRQAAAGSAAGSGVF